MNKNETMTVEGSKNNHVEDARQPAIVAEGMALPVLSLGKLNSPEGVDSSPLPGVRIKFGFGNLMAQVTRLVKREDYLKNQWSTYQYDTCVAYAKPLCAIFYARALSSDLGKREMRKRISKIIKSSVQLLENLLKIQEGALKHDPSGARYSKRDQWLTDERLLKTVKYWNDLFLAKAGGHLGSLPKRSPEVKGCPYSGYFLRMIKRNIARRGRGIGFIQSLGKAKACFPQASPCLENGTFDQSKIDVSRELTPICPEMEFMLRKATRLVFQDLIAGNKPFLKCLPTGHSCLQSSRKQGGTMSISVDFNIDHNLESCLGVDRGFDESFLEWTRFHLRDSYRIIEESKTITEFKMMPIYDPGKVRIVSVGNGGVANFLAPLQGAMLSCWKDTHFSTMLWEDLEPKIQLMDEEKELEYFVSGDYSRATDLVNRNATFIVLDELKRAGIPGINTAIKSFGPGKCIYPDGSSVEHRNAQFMGHWLSFPILCTLNVAILLRMGEKWVGEVGDEEFQEAKRRERLSRRALMTSLINGDDILFKSTLGLYKHFMTCAAEVGLKASPGKQLLAKDVGMINSRIFRRKAGIMTRVHYLKTKIIFGGQNSDAGPVEVCKDLNKMFEKLTWGKMLIPLALNRFPNLKVGKFHGFKPNWFLPVHLGGYGLDIKHRTSGAVTVTRAQRLVAAHLIKDPQNLFLGTTEKISKVVKPQMRRIQKKTLLPNGMEALPGLKFNRSQKDLELAKSRLRLTTEETQLGSEISGLIVEFADEGEKMESVKACSDPANHLRMVNRIITGRNERIKEVMVRRIPRDYRLSPVSMEKLLEYYFPEYAYRPVSFTFQRPDLRTIVREQDKT